MEQWREPTGTVLSLGGLVVWIAGGVAAAVGVPRVLQGHPQVATVAVGMLVVVAGVGGLVIFWVLSAEIDFWRRGYGVRQLGPKEFFHWTLGPKRCVYEERGQDGRLRSLPFVRIILADGYPAPSELRFPSEDAWDAQVPCWARGRRSEIVRRVSELLALSHVVELPPN